MDEYTYIVNIDGVVIRDDEYLLIERGANEDHASGLLAFPGGKVEQQPGSENAIETTVRRELSEEVGVEVGTVEYVLSTTFETDDGSQCLNIVTLCEHEAGNAHPRASDEVAEDSLAEPEFVECHFFRADELDRDLVREGFDVITAAGLEGVASNFDYEVEEATDDQQESLAEVVRETREDRDVADLSNHILAVCRA